MDNIHKHFSVAAFCAAFLFLMSFGAFGQNVIYSCDFEDNAETPTGYLQTATIITVGT